MVTRAVYHSERPPFPNTVNNICDDRRAGAKFYKVTKVVDYNNEMRHARILSQIILLLRS